MGQGLIIPFNIALSTNHLSTTQLFWMDKPQLGVFLWLDNSTNLDYLIRLAFFDLG